MCQSNGFWGFLNFRALKCALPHCQSHYYARSTIDKFPTPRLRDGCSFLPTITKKKKNYRVPDLFDKLLRQEKFFFLFLFRMSQSVTGQLVGLMDFEQKSLLCTTPLPPSNSLFFFWNYSLSSPPPFFLTNFFFPPTTKPLKDIYL